MLVQWQERIYKLTNHFTSQCQWSKPLNNSWIVPFCCYQRGPFINFSIHTGFFRITCDGGSLGWSYVLFISFLKDCWHGWKLWANIVLCIIIEEIALHLLQYLPKEELYIPPLHIHIMDKRSYGRTPIIGTHSIKSLVNFFTDTTSMEVLLYKEMSLEGALMQYP